MRLVESYSHSCGQAERIHLMREEGDPKGATTGEDFRRESRSFISEYQAVRGLKTNLT